VGLANAVNWLFSWLSKANFPPSDGDKGFLGFLPVAKHYRTNVGPRKLITSFDRVINMLVLSTHHHQHHQQHQHQHHQQHQHQHLIPGTA